MSLDPGVGRVRHEVEEPGDHPGVELLLEDGSEVRGHLADGVTAGVPARHTSPWPRLVTRHYVPRQHGHVTLHVAVPDPRVGVRDIVHDALHELLEVRLHLLVATLPGGGDGHEGRVTVLPVRVLEG